MSQISMKVAEKAIQNWVTVEKKFVISWYQKTGLRDLI